MFDNPDIFYLDRPNFQGPWALSDQDLQQIKNHQLTIIDLSSEHWGANGIDEAYKKFNSLGINFLLLSHEPSDHKKFERMLYYPHWYFYSVKNFALPKEVSITKTYNWSCLNLNPRVHRVHNFILSRNKSYFSQAKFSMHDFPENLFARCDDVVLDQDVIDEWNTLRSTLSHVRNTCDFGLDLTIPELSDSYVHLVTESSILPRVFITEKTWKPIAMQQIFLVFGTPGTIASLRQLGVDVFDDIVDHSYDNESNWERRLNMVHNSLESLLSQDLQSIYQETKSRREHNQVRFRNKEFGLQYQQELTSTIAQYL